MRVRVRACMCDIVTQIATLNIIFNQYIGALLMKKAKDALNHPEGLPKKKAVTILGKQPCSTIWALGPDFFIEETTGLILILFVMCDPTPP